MVFRITSGKHRGFTFVEVMVVLAIVALLLTIALPRYFSGLDRAKEAVLKQDLVIMREAIDKYHADKGIYPPTLEALVEQKYLREIPVDPMTESDETWLIMPLNETANSVYDIRSGSQYKASDGSFYSEW